MADVEIPDPHEVSEKAENPFTKVVALCVAVYAVGLAFASFGGSNTTKEMLFNKQEEAHAENAAKQEEFNTWSQFQSKSTREALYRNEKEKLVAEKEGNPATFPPFKQKLLDDYAKQEARMKADKEELAAKAKEVREKGEATVAKINGELKRLLRQDPYFDFAEVGFQLAIVLSSVAMLANKRWAFYVSLLLAAVSGLLTMNGFFLLVAVPGLDGTGH